ncbi:dihydroorotase [Chryseolinea lacunae]|uniref:Dihydroorotase n=1 Tax=Chryseolinea lacunae TaxID=2801331 RepID=A0ABS1KR32_9BACT|nr:dihydroorotase [Chryseolinea lacunae]MBL0741930.1 dihydroorotase [Chryseolinea lacunae]
MKTLLITNANIVNEGKVFEGDVLIRGQYIEAVGKNLASHTANEVIDAKGKYLLPGVIDDQVHFREPGLTHKGNIRSESRAAVAGGVTSFMEMPNTNPPTFTQDLLEQKYVIASHSSLANYSFFMGAANDNLDEVMKTDITRVCGLKIFMGSSTGNLLVDDPKTLEQFFSRFPSLIAAHCEDEATIRKNTAEFKARYGEEVPIRCHPLIRSAEACYLSSSFAIDLARKNGTRFHILHISTAKETALFDNSIPLEKKLITAEACIHHLWFNDSDYDRLGTFIKWNPAIKTAHDQAEVFKAVLDDRIDVIATDHAPHTREEKQNTYFKAPSGGPLVQHSLVAMLEFYHQGKITLETIVQKMSHNPAILFRIQKRGFIREGYFADLVLADLNDPWTVGQENIVAQCGWSPFEGATFRSKVHHTFVSGHRAYSNGRFDDAKHGERLLFDRK